MTSLQPSFVPSQPGPTDNDIDMGDVQLQVYTENGRICVAVVKARACYLKLYLMDDSKCISKKKTRLSRRSLEPVFQQKFEFKKKFKGRQLEVKIWGNYERMDRKMFFGMCKIDLNILDLTCGDTEPAWYKLSPLL
ncbi:regulating synaptic membrane exocytosis protein 4-like [Saccoglossus kowalevskii]|uniref:Regulating synaptic membrane exocytosis protein 4-like n=1 Tax=Saccoglossus kowalevskii TaxID=10224 RepID=A0ABM0M2Y5_SACKO|nr:PREDICTED: regulating synaptic membrane exocytosis protein 4-like [Saccoglossus kowalevskii]